MSEPATLETSPLGWFHPAGRAYRFTVLVFAGFLIYGSYFAYDSIGAIGDSLMPALGIGQGEIGTLYSMYSIGPMLFLFLAGFLVDRLGTRAASLLFTSLITLGAVVVAASSSIWPMYAGRFVFGFASEAAIVAQNAILVRWFRGKELALAFGVVLTISRLGTLFSFNTEALIAQRHGPTAALWVAAGLCGVSVLANLIYVIMDRHAERALKLTEGQAGDRIVLGEIKKLGAPFWMVTALCFTFYSAIFPFTALSTNFFHEKWALPLTAATGGGFLAEVFASFRHMFTTAPGTTSIVIFASMVFAPFAGGLVDRIGRRGRLMIGGSLLMIPSYLALGFTHLPSQLPMVLLGAAFVLVPAAMWPSVPLVVDKRVTGTAYGVMTQLQNIGLGLFPLLNGQLREKTGGYQASMVMFAGLGVLGLVFAFALRHSDRKAGGVLERP
jgi:MFS family permease